MPTFLMAWIGLGGAQNYAAAEFSKHGREFYTHYPLCKPSGGVDSGEIGPEARVETIHYLYGFINVLVLLDLPGGGGVPDVICGSGCISQFYARMDYEVHGLDLYIDMVDLIRQRLR